MPQHRIVLFLGDLPEVSVKLFLECLSVLGGVMVVFWYLLRSVDVLLCLGQLAVLDVAGHSHIRRRLRG